MFRDPVLSIDGDIQQGAAGTTMPLPALPNSLLGYFILIMKEMRTQSNESGTTYIHIKIPIIIVATPHT